MLLLLIHMRIKVFSSLFLLWIERELQDKFPFISTRLLFYPFYQFAVFCVGRFLKGLCTLWCDTFTEKLRLICSLNIFLTLKELNFILLIKFKFPWFNPKHANHPSCEKEVRLFTNTLHMKTKSRLKGWKRFMISLNFFLNGGVYVRCVLNKYFAQQKTTYISEKKGWAIFFLHLFVFYSYLLNWISHMYMLTIFSSFFSMEIQFADNNFLKDTFIDFKSLKNYSFSDS